MDGVAFAERCERAWNPQPEPVVAEYFREGDDVTGRLPNFFNALKAVWLMTWMSQLTLTRLPMRMAELLVLPALVLITVSPPGRWLHRSRPVWRPRCPIASILQAYGETANTRGPRPASEAAGYSHG